VTCPDRRSTGGWARWRGQEG